MPTDLRDALTDLAGSPDSPPLTDDLWRQATRRRRTRRGVVAALFGAMLTVVTILAVSPPTSRVPAIDLDPVGTAPPAEPTPPPGTGTGATPAAAPLPLTDATLAMLADDETVLVRPDDDRQPLPALAVDRGVMLADGTFVYEAYPPGASLVGDPPIWAVPADGNAVRLAEGTAAAGTRQLVGTREGEAALVLVVDPAGDPVLEAWDGRGGREVLGDVPADWLDQGMHVSVMGPLVAVAGSANPGVVELGRLDRSGPFTPLTVRSELPASSVLDVVHAPEQVAVLLAGGARDGATGQHRAEVVLLDAESGDEVGRYAVPATTWYPDAGFWGAAAQGLAAHDDAVAVHLRRAEMSDDPWRASQVLDTSTGEWTRAPLDGPAYPLPAPTSPPAACGEVPAPVGAGDAGIWLPCGRTGAPGTHRVPIEGPGVGLKPADTEAAVTAALRVMFDGPGPAAEEAGYVAVFPRDPVRGVSLRGTTAVVDLAGDQLDGYAGGATLAAAHFASAVARTATQFDGVDSVEVHVDGSCDEWARRNEASGCRVLMPGG